MKLISNDSRLNGRVEIPSSKSHTIRAVTFGILADGQSIIHNPLKSQDTSVALTAGAALGAVIDTSDDTCWKVKGTAGNLTAPGNDIDMGNSGTTLYIMMGVSSLISEGSVVLTGDEQTRRRPAQPLIDALNKLGPNLKSISGNGCAPIKIKGKLKGGYTSVEAVTSQYLTSLLISCPLAENDTRIDVPLLYERPYVEMTLSWLDRLGIQYEHNPDMKLFKIPGKQSYKAIESSLPGDFSSATFFLVAGALSDGKIVLSGLDMNDTQGDKAVIGMLRQMGADIDVNDNEIIVTGGGLNGAKLDLNNTPDALPAMAVAGCFARGETILHNVEQARRKETDRITVMAKELKKFGADIEEMPDGLIIKGGKKIKGCCVNGHGDHRIVMSLAVAGLFSEGTVTIDTAEAVSVTFPDFVKLMRMVGANIDTVE